MIRMKVVGLDKVQKSFAYRQSMLVNLKPLFTVIAAKAHRNVIDHFEKEKGPKRKWPRWSRKNPKTGIRTFFSSRPYGRGGNKILQDTGRLKGSVRFTGKRRQAEVFTNVKYAKFHQKGTKNMVKRPFMYIDRKTRKNIVNFMEGKLAKGKK